MPSASVASNSSKVPLNVITPLCFTAKPMLECTESRLQVPVGTVVVCSVVLIALPWSVVYA